MSDHIIMSYNQDISRTWSRGLNTFNYMHRRQAHHHSNDLTVWLVLMHFSNGFKRPSHHFIVHITITVSTHEYEPKSLLTWCSQDMFKANGKWNAIRVRPMAKWTTLAKWNTYHFAPSTIYSGTSSKTAHHHTRNISISSK